MKNLILVLLISAVSTVVYSQQMYQQWVARYNGTANSIDWAAAVAVDNNSNVYVTGFATNNNTSKDMITIKYDENGNILWVRTYNGEVNGGDYSFALVLDAQSNVYVTGRSDRGGPTFSDITTIKYNTNGVQQWVAFYNGPDNLFDEGRCLKVDNSGNVYVAGRSDGTTSGQDMVVVKYNSSGAQQWAKRYNGTANGNDAAWSIDVDASGNVFVSGQSVGIGTNNDFVVIKYNTVGDQQWLERYNSSGDDASRVVEVDASGNVYSTGYCTYNNNYDYLTMKLNTDGNVLWATRFNGSANLADLASAMALDSYGNVYVTGRSVGGANVLDSDYATVKYNTNGVQQWVAIYKGSNNTPDVPRAITLDDHGNVYVSGGSYSTTFNDYTTVKYKNGGGQDWVLRYNGPANNDDFSNAVAVDGLGNVYITGYSTGLSSNYDIATIKYSATVGVSNNGNEIPTNYSLSQNYPNPFNPTTTISFELPKQSDVSLSVYNSIGEEISVIVNDKLSAGKYRINFDGSNISSGIYFYRLQAGDFTQTKKMILIK
jgi:uncharacterized delta-60 repeat protein